MDHLRSNNYNIQSINRITVGNVTHLFLAIIYVWFIANRTLHSHDIQQKYIGRVLFTERVHLFL